MARGQFDIIHPHGALSGALSSAKTKFKKKPDGTHARNNKTKHPQSTTQTTSNTL
jgi:hypothetical protein